MIISTRIALNVVRPGAPVDPPRGFVRSEIGHDRVTGHSGQIATVTDSDPVASAPSGSTTRKLNVTVVWFCPSGMLTLLVSKVVWKPGCPFTVGCNEPCASSGSVALNPTVTV